MKISAYKKDGTKYNVNIRVIDRVAIPFIRIKEQEYEVKFSHRINKFDYSNPIPVIQLSKAAQKALGAAKYQHGAVLRCDDYQNAKESTLDNDLKDKKNAKGKNYFYYRHCNNGFELFAVKNDFIIKNTAFFISDDSINSEPFETETMNLIGAKQYSMHAPLIEVSKEEIKKLLQIAVIHNVKGFVSGHEFLPKKTSFNRTYNAVVRCSHYKNLVKKNN